MTFFPDFLRMTIGIIGSVIGKFILRANFFNQPRGVEPRGVDSGNFLLQLRGVRWLQVLKACFGEYSALFLPAQLKEQFFPGHLKIENCRKI